MLLATLCFAVLPTNVSLDIPALPVPKLVKEISTLTGLPLEAAPNLNVDIVGVRLRDVPIAEVKQRLASLIGAKWESHDNREVLSRPPYLLRQQEFEETEEKSEEIRKIISVRPTLGEFEEAVAGTIVSRSNALVEQLHERFVTPEHEKTREQLRALTSQTPLQRFLERLLPALDSKQVAELQPSEALVFSSRPNRLQSPLNQVVLKNAVETYRREQTMFRKAVDRSGPRAYSKADDSRYGTWEAEPTFDKILLKVFVSQWTGLPRYWLFLVDQEGKITGTAYTSLQRTPPASTNHRLSGQLLINSSAVEWNRLFSRMIAPNRFDPESKKPVRALVEHLLPIHSNPDQHEPLAVGVGHAFGRLGEEHQRNVMALIPDCALTWTEAQAEKQKCEKFIATAEKNWIGTFDVDSNWITYRPRYLSQGRRERIDRLALGNLFREARESGQLTVSSVARYSFAAPIPLYYPNYEETVIGYTEGIEGYYSSKHLIDWSIRPFMKLLGSLSESQLKTVLEGGSVSYSQLSARAADQLNKLVYGEPDIMRGFFAPAVSWTANEWKEMLGTVDFEATESLRNGIPGTTLISCDTSWVPAIIRPANDDYPLTSSDSLSTFAIQMAFNDSSEEDDERPFSLGSARQYKFQIDFGDGRHFKREVNELATSGRTNYKSWKQFPSHVQSQIEETLLKEREIIKKRREQGKTAPPPP